MSYFRALAPILPVSSMPRSLAFYRTLGFTARRYDDGDTYAFLSREQLELHLRFAPDLVADHSPSGVYFFLQSGGAVALLAEFEAAGVAVLSSLAVREWMMNEFILSDPDGNLLRFGEPA